jgi:hypothetical protein
MMRTTAVVFMSFEFICKQLNSQTAVGESTPLAHKALRFLGFLKNCFNHFSTLTTPLRETLDRLFIADKLVALI